MRRCRKTETTLIFSFKVGVDDNDDERRSFIALSSISVDLLECARTH